MLCSGYSALHGVNPNLKKANASASAKTQLGVWGALEAPKFFLAYFELSKFVLRLTFLIALYSI